MQSFFGLDIGASSIKLVQVNLMGSKSFGVEAIGLVTNPAGSIDFTDKVVVEKIKPALKKLLTESKVKERRVVVSVAESKVYSRILSIPQMSEAELSSAIHWEAEQFVPIPVNEVELDFSVIEKLPGSEEKKMSVYLVAAPKKYLQGLVELLTAVNLEPIAVESEMVAIARALTYGQPAMTSLLVHIGAMSSVMAIVEGSNLTFSYTVPVGGVAMSRALSQSLGLPLTQAEEYKRTYGLQENQLEGKVRKGLLIVMDSLVREMRKAMEFQLASRKSVVNRVVVTGGGAYLPELVVYLSGVLGGVEVVLGNPLEYGKPGRGVTLPAEKAAYAIATGLSQRMF